MCIRDSLYIRNVIKVKPSNCINEKVLPTSSPRPRNTCSVNRSVIMKEAQRHKLCKTASFVLNRTQEPYVIYDILIRLYMTIHYSTCCRDPNAERINDTFRPRFSIHLLWTSLLSNVITDT